MSDAERSQFTFCIAANHEAGTLAKAQLCSLPPDVILARCTFMALLFWCDGLLFDGGGVAVS
jgi:hypothetical protein